MQRDQYNNMDGYDPGTAIAATPQGIAVVPSRLSRSRGSEIYVWLIVVAALVTVYGLRRTFKGLIPGT